MGCNYSHMPFQKHNRHFTVMHVCNYLSMPRSWGKHVIKAKGDPGCLCTQQIKRGSVDWNPRCVKISILSSQPLLSPATRKLASWQLSHFSDALLILCTKKRREWPRRQTSKPAKTPMEVRRLELHTNLYTNDGNRFRGMSKIIYFI